MHIISGRICSATCLSFLRPGDLFPLVEGCVYKQTGQTAGFCISDFLSGLQPQSRLQEAPWAPFVCWLDWGSYFPQRTMLSLSFLPLCALQPPPSWNTHHPAFSSRPEPPCSVLWLPPSDPDLRFLPPRLLLSPWPLDALAKRVTWSSHLRLAQLPCEVPDTTPLS